MRWATLQAVVSPGPNPLPVAIHMKTDQKNGNLFYYVDQGTWNWEFMEPAFYTDPVQGVVHIVIQRSLIKTFGLFKWTLDRYAGKYFPKLPLPQQGCIYKVIEAVKKEIARHSLEYSNDTDELENLALNVESHKNKNDRLPHIWSRLSTSFLARLNLTSTFAACKNWNSHGATVGAALCQLGALLASLDTASVEPLMGNDFRELILIGNALMGQKYGHCDTVYVEYMTSVS